MNPVPLPIEIHVALKKLVTQQEIKAVREYAAPYIAAQHVLNLNDPARSCALIDSLDPLTAAFIVNVLRQWAQDSNEFKLGSQTILTLAAKLKIQGLKGLCHARDEIYKRTGAFVT